MNTEIEQPAPSPEYEFSEAISALKKFIRTNGLKTADSVTFGEIIGKLYRSVSRKPDLPHNKIQEAHSILTDLKQNLKDGQGNPFISKIGQIERTLKELDALLEIRQIPIDKKPAHISEILEKLLKTRTSAGDTFKA